MSDYSFIYECTGTEDDSAIQNIVNGFFANETAMTMNLIVTGTMGLRDDPSNGRFIDISATNSRKATCNLDFSDCHIPQAYSARAGGFFCITNSAVRVNVTGLSCFARSGVYLNNAQFNTFNNCKILSTTGTGVSLANARGNAFENCMICSYDHYGLEFQTTASDSINTFDKCTIIGGYGQAVLVNSSCSGSTVFENCLINGGVYGISVLTADPASEIKLICCGFKSGTQDLRQTSAASTVRWHISGCLFSKTNVVIDGSTAITNKTSDYVYFPQYANRFNVAVQTDIPNPEEWE